MQISVNDPAYVNSTNEAVTFSTCLGSKYTEKFLSTRANVYLKAKISWNSHSNFKDNLPYY